jgi:hypothetical protein
VPSPANTSSAYRRIIRIGMPVRRSFVNTSIQLRSSSL